MKLPSVKLPGLGRRKADEEANQRLIEAAELAAAAVGKGRPTPKRRDAQGRRSGPALPPPTTRKEAYRRMRERGVRQVALFTVIGRPQDQASQALNGSALPMVTVTDVESVALS